MRTFFITTDDKRCYKSVSCNCQSFIKWDLCTHEVAYNNAYLLDIYGKEYRQSNKFVKKIKKGAKPKRSGRYKLASSALNTDD